MFDLRPATMADADQLFEWANDPVTRANSRSTAAISRYEHQRWMDLNVAHGYPTHLVMIAENDYGPVGVVRFDADKFDILAFHVSLTVAPAERAKGHGFAMLQHACQIMQDSTLLAEIRSSNVASQQIFTKCGFESYDHRHGLILYRREPTG